MEITIKQAKQAIEYNIDHNIKRAILLLGAPGIGKSSIVKDICYQRDMGFIDLRLLLFTETDLKGIPYPEKDTHTTRWFPNDILPRLSRDKPRGILLIDELTSAPKRTQAAAYQLIQDRQIGEYKLPDGWFIVAAGNREDDDGVFVQMPSPLANRFEIYDIRPDLDVWKEEYAYKYNINSDVIAYLNFNPSALHTQVAGESDMLFCSPRSWSAVGDVLDTNPPENLLRLKVAANIGDVYASGFMEFLKYKDSLTSVSSILNGADVAVPKERSQQYLLITGLVSYFAFLKDPDLSDHELWDVQLTNALNFIVKFSPEMLALSLRDLVMLNKKRIKNFILGSYDSPKLYEFLENNKYIFD